VLAHVCCAAEAGHANGQYHHERYTAKWSPVLFQYVNFGFIYKFVVAALLELTFYVVVLADG